MRELSDPPLRIGDERVKPSFGVPDFSENDRTDNSRFVAQLRSQHRRSELFRVNLEHLVVELAERTEKHLATSQHAACQDDCVGADENGCVDQTLEPA